MKLHHEVLTAPDAVPTKTVLFVHGILGTGANLRSHARRFIQSRPEFQAVLVDLRAHGDSQGVEGADTLANCANDLEQTAQSLSPPVRAVVGHSFGGKVALEYARVANGLEAVMTLDSTPGTRIDARGSESTLQVITMLDGMERTWPTRDAFIAAVESHGVARSLGQWLAMNLEPRQGAFTFKLSMPRIHALIDDYLAVDLWPVVADAARTQQGPRLHLVIGTKSTVYSPEELAHARELEAQSSGHVTVDLLNAGHWVHVEDPQGLSDVLIRRLT